MKSLRIALILVSALGFAGLTACSSTPEGQKQTAKASAGIDKLTQHVAQVDTAVGTTATALKVMQRQQMQDPQRVLNTFREAVATLDKAVQNADKTKAGMEKSFELYFTTWQNQLSTVQDEELRKVSDKRRAELTEILADLKASSAEARDEFNVYYGKLKDLQTVLEMDYTPGAITALSSKIDEVVELADASRDSLADVVAELRKVQGLTSSSGLAK